MWTNFDALFGIWNQSRRTSDQGLCFQLCSHWARHLWSRCKNGHSSIIILIQKLSSQSADGCSKEFQNYEHHLPQPAFNIFLNGNETTKLYYGLVLYGLTDFLFRLQVWANKRPEFWRYVSRKNLLSPHCNHERSQRVGQLVTYSQQTANVLSRLNIVVSANIHSSLPVPVAAQSEA